MNARRFAYSVATLLMLPVALGAQAHDASVANHEPHLYAAADFGIDPEAVTFTKDIAPILQRSCQSCHRPDGGAPMSLVDYDDVQRYGRRIARRTAIRDLRPSSNSALSRGRLTTRPYLPSKKAGPFTSTSSCRVAIPRTFS